MPDDVVLNNLEDDVPVPEPVAPVPEPVAVAPADGEDIDPNAVDLKDETRVRGLLAELSRQRGTVRDLKAKAGEVDQLRQAFNEAKPYVEFLRNNPTLMQQRQPEPVQPQQDDPRALEIAKGLDFYTAEGKPDVARGAAHLRLLREEARAIAAETVQPMVQDTTRQRSAANYQSLLQMKNAAGQPLVTEQALRAVWGTQPADLTAQPEVAAWLAMAALGKETWDKSHTKHVPVPPPALETEGSGGNARTRQTISDLEEGIVKERGMTAAKWNEHTKGYQAGRGNVLED